MTSVPCTVPPRFTPVPSEMAETELAQRDHCLQPIAERSHMGWQKASHCDRGAGTVAVAGCSKRVIGDGLHSARLLLILVELLSTT